VKHGQALKLVNNDLGIASIVRNEVLEITSREDAESHLVLRTFPVADLLRLRSKAEDGSEYDGLRDVLQRSVKPESWNDAGGPGSLEFLRSAGVMVVAQTADNHGMITRLLARMRQAQRQVTDAKEEARLAVIDCEQHAEANARIYAKLKRTISIDWSDIPVRDWPSILERDYALTASVSLSDLQNSGLDVSVPVTLKLSNISLRSVLHHLTKLSGMGWVVRNGALVITSKEDVETYVTTRIYPVPDLKPREDEMNDRHSLEHVIKNSVRPDSWRDAAGPGEVISCDRLGCLICVQTREVHEQIEQLLASIRRDGGAASAPRATGEMVLRVYKIEDLTLAMTGQADDPFGKQPARRGDPPGKEPGKPQNLSAGAVAAVVRDLVAPESWEAAGSKAYLRSLGDRLIVRQSPRVHREIRTLLEKLGVLADGQPAGGGFFYTIRRRRSKAANAVTRSAAVDRPIIPPRRCATVIYCAAVSFGPPIENRCL
jgi:hypothetical protein